MTPNQEYGRRGHAIQGFVIHITEGTFISACKWIENPQSQVSYHFLIDRDGEDVCLVMPEHTAWHAGLVKNPTPWGELYGSNPNLTSIGIAFAGVHTEPPTLKQVAKCASLIQYLAPYYNITLDRKSVIKHNDIRTDKACPGSFIDIDTIIYLAKLPQ